jgi:hypothetical protein
MGYANATYYKTSYYGTAIPSDTAQELTELERLLNRASELVDDATYNRSRAFEELSEYEQEMIRKATCAEAESLYEFGDDGNAGNINSYSIGDVSVSMDNSSDDFASNFLSEKSIKYLKNTMLISRLLG